MASISQIKLPNNSVYDIKAKYDVNGNIISDTYLRKDFELFVNNFEQNSRDKNLYLNLFIFVFSPSYYKSP